MDNFTKLNLRKKNNQSGWDDTNVKQELHKDLPKD